MAVEFKLPELGENVTSGDVTRVLVKVGDTIKVDQAVIEMETGKATVEIPSSVAGVVKQIHVKEGGKAQVGQLLLTIDASAASAATKAEPAKKAPPAAAPTPPSAPTTPPPAPPVPPPVQPSRVRSAPQIANPPPIVASGKYPVPAAPSTRQFAREVGVDITQVPGSGPGGRISVSDVKLFARANAAGFIAGGRPAPAPLPDLAKWGDVERQPMSAVRQATAEHMANCWSTIPHVTLHDKADITDLEKLRQEQKRKIEASGGKLTLTAFLIKILGGALKVFPNFNSALDTTTNEHVLRKYYNVGVAMDSAKGLIVPVIRGVDSKSVAQIAKDLADHGEKAKAGKVAIADMQGGCISLTNLGGIGCGFFTPIINHPEVAILGVGKAQMEPVMVNGFFQPRLMAPLSLSFDHRAVDGADGARFLQWIIQAIQQPALISLEG